jgi:ribose transport system substrate-binding protein
MTFFDQKTLKGLNRRDFLKTSAGITAALAAQGLMPSRASAADDFQAACVFVSSTNAYMLDLARGAEIFAKSVGIPFKAIDANGDSQQQLSQVQATIAAGKKLIMTICAVNSADIPSIVRAVSHSGGYVTSHWNKPKGYHPWSQPDNYVAHMGYDGYSCGKWIATEMFKAMGGKGGVIAFKGRLDAVPSQQRYEGLLQALKDFPDIQLLDTQVGNWERQQAFDITKTMMTKYGEKLGGVWCASDSMATGAYAAVEQAGRLEKVKFVGVDANPEALKLIDSGESYVASYTSDGVYNGAVGLALAYAAATGKVDVKSLSHEQREGNYNQVSINKANIKQYLQPAQPDQVIAEVNKGFFARLNGPTID